MEVGALSNATRDAESALLIRISPTMPKIHIPKILAVHPSSFPRMWIINLSTGVKTLSLRVKEAVTSLQVTSWHSICLRNMVSELHSWLIDLLGVMV